MKTNRKKPEVNTGLSRQKRRGVTAVEFAVVCPLVLAMMFGMLEISRMSTIVDSVRTSVIAGAREATIANTTAVYVEQEMDRMLNMFGIRESTVIITPEVIDPSVTEVTIQIEVPFNSANGLYLVTLPQANNVQMKIVVNR